MRDLREGRINEFVRNALLQSGAVTRCEHRGDVLLHNGDDGAENTARLMVADWLGREGGVDHIMPHEIREAIVSILDGAAKDGCPECARREGS
jgi:hypothetical protein